MVGEFVSSVLRDGLEFLDPVRGLPPRPALPVKEGRRDASVGQQFVRSHESLMNVDRGCADLIDAADDLQIIAKVTWPAICDIYVGHRHTVCTYIPICR